jgi:hypothetical protein
VTEAAAPTPTTAGMQVLVQASPAGAADSYARRGFRVVPLHAVEHGACTCPRGADCGGAGKHPRIRAWQTDASADPQRVGEWFRRWPRANVGLAMGGLGRLVALDVDGPAGRESLARFEAEHGPLPITLTSRSGRPDGGEHRIFTVAPGLDLNAIGNTAGEVAPGLDVRAEGGQIVVAPSIHRSGAAYTWTSEAPIAELPRWLYDLLAPRTAPAPCPPTFPQQADPTRYGEAALENACSEIRSTPKGSRNQILNREAFALGGLVAAGALRAHEVESGLVAAMHAGGWDARAIRSLHTATLRRALAEGQRSPRVIPERQQRAHHHAAAAPHLEPEPLAPADQADALAVLLDELAGLDAEERTTRMVEQDALDVILDCVPSERSPEGARLLEALRRAGVRVNTFKLAWRGAAKQQRDRSAPTHAPAVGEPSQPTRPRIMITTEEHEVNDQAVAALAARPGLYQRAHALVRVVEEDQLVPGHAAPVRRRSIRRLEQPTLRELLSRVAEWRELREGEDGPRPMPAHVPEWSVRAVHARGAWTGIQRLAGVVEAPVLRPDGSVLDEPGYDERTGLLYVPSGEFPRVLESPQAPDVAEARDMLLDLVKLFPFEDGPGGVHASAWLAALLTPIARWAFDGPAPLLAFTANIPGAGKTLLADVIGWIVLGAPLPRRPLPEDEDELQKVITTIALEGAQFAFFDDLRRPIGPATLNEALTSTSWSGRLLGKNESPVLPLHTVFFASGNNLEVHDDTRRRTLLVRLDSPEARPEERAGLPSIEGFVRTHRGDLLCAALTILRAWLLSDRSLPELDGGALKPWHSFEGWSAVVRGAVVACGLPDPGEARATMSNDGEEAVAGLGVFIKGWSEICAVLAGERGGLTVTEVLDALRADDQDRRGTPWSSARPARWQTLRSGISELCKGLRAGELPTSSALGYVLRRYKRRNVGGMRLAYTKTHGDGRWAVEAVGAK